MKRWRVGWDPILGLRRFVLHCGSGGWVWRGTAARRCCRFWIGGRGRRIGRCFRRHGCGRRLCQLYCRKRLRGAGGWRGIQSADGVSVTLGSERGGSQQTRRLSSVRRTATPASTLPTVRDMSIATRMKIGSWSLGSDEQVYNDRVAAPHTSEEALGLGISTPDQARRSF